MPLGHHRNRAICCQPAIVLPRAHRPRERRDQHVGGGRAERLRQVCEYGLGQFRIEFDGHGCGRSLTDRRVDVEPGRAKSGAWHPVVEFVVDPHRCCQCVVPGSGRGHLWSQCHLGAGAQRTPSGDDVLDDDWPRDRVDGQVVDGENDTGAVVSGHEHRSDHTPRNGVETAEGCSVLGTDQRLELC